MKKPGITPEIQKEFEQARNWGAVLDIALPLSTGIIMVLLIRKPVVTLEIETELKWLFYALVLFSVSISFIAKTVLSRLMDHCKRMLLTDRYTEGRIKLSYIVLYVLYLCPALWGIAYYALTSNLIALAALTSITVMSYFFLTPSLPTMFKE